MSPIKRQARIAGVLYVVFLVGLLRLLYVPGKLFVEGNAAATAANIVAHETLFRAGIVAGLLSSVFFLMLGLALYRLLGRVSQSQAVMMMIFIALSVAMDCLNALNDLAALQLARGGDYLSVIDQPQREALSMVFLDLHDHSYRVNEMFWGLWLLPLALLVFRSGFLPRLLGVWLGLAGVSWVAISLTGLLAPPYADLVFRITHPFRLAEIAFLLWLLIMGAKEPLAPAAAAA